MVKLVTGVDVGAAAVYASASAALLWTALRIKLFRRWNKFPALFAVSTAIGLSAGAFFAHLLHF